MASTNKTTNYELSQFEGSDKPSWEADYNADMLIIDTNMKAISDVANGASDSISTLADRVTTAEGNISTNANDIDALEARADALEAGETTADGRLDAIETEQIMQNTAIEGNTQLAYNIARPYDSASTYEKSEFALFQNTLYKCNTEITTGEAFDPEKWTAIKVMDEVEVTQIPTDEAFDSINTTDFNISGRYFFKAGRMIVFQPSFIQVANANGLSANTWHNVGTLNSKIRPMMTMRIPAILTNASDTPIDLAYVKIESGVVSVYSPSALTNHALINLNAIYPIAF